LNNGCGNWFSHEIDRRPLTSLEACQAWCLERADCVGISISKGAAAAATGRSCVRQNAECQYHFNADWDVYTLVPESLSPSPSSSPSPSPSPSSSPSASSSPADVSGWSHWINLTDPPFA
jgi:hypothetical protein